MQPEAICKPGLDLAPDVRGQLTNRSAQKIRVRIRVQTAEDTPIDEPPQWSATASQALKSHVLFLYLAEQLFSQSLVQFVVGRLRQFVQLRFDLTGRHPSPSEGACTRR